MFEIGFWELFLVTIIALWALGPEKLPVVAHIAGRALSRAKQAYLNLKQEFE
jgi:sec-independent protein translocase protein TatB